MQSIHELEQVLRDRKAAPPPGSYAAGLLADPERVQRKIIEEAFEVCLELGRVDRDDERIAAEAADLVFHLLVGLVLTDVPFERVIDELTRRRR